MPVITINSPALNKKQKKELVSSFAKTASDIMGLPVSAIVIIINEVESENVGVGDTLLCDLQESE